MYMYQARRASSHVYVPSQESGAVSSHVYVPSQESEQSCICTKPGEEQSCICTKPVMYMYQAGE